MLFALYGVQHLGKKVLSRSAQWKPWTQRQWGSWQDS
jgi:hypothetical protein